jgi:hypothetical protein
MGTTNSSGFKTFKATAAAIAEAVRVTYDSNGLIAASGDTGISIGVTVEPIAASGYGTVKLFASPGTFFMTAGAAITRGALLYPLASGKVDDTGTTSIAMIALEAATADGDIIECAHIKVGA